MPQSPLQVLAPAKVNQPHRHKSPSPSPLSREPVKSSSLRKRSVGRTTGSALLNSRVHHGLHTVIPLNDGAAHLEDIGEVARDEEKEVSQLLEPTPLSTQQQLPPASPKKKIDWEIPRKTLHSSIGFVTVALYALHVTVPPIVLALAGALIFVASCDFVRLSNPQFARLYERVVGFLMRASEREKINGVVWYLIGVIFVLSVYPVDIALASILILSWADTTASTFGRAFGRYTPPLPRRIPLVRLPFAPRKSMAGFIAAFVTGSLIAAGVWGTRFLTNAHMDMPFGLTIPPQVAIPIPKLNSMPSTFDIPENIVMPLLTSGRDAASWVWSQPVGGGILGFAGLSLWAGIVAAVVEALDVGEWDDNLTLPILSGGAIWGYLALLNRLAS